MSFWGVLAMDQSHTFKDYAGKDHAGSGLDGPPQGLGSRVLQKLASFMYTATHPAPVPEQTAAQERSRPEH